MTNEQIYDEQVNPLMQQIIAICKEHGIPMMASFQLESYDDVEQPSPLMCSTVLPGNQAGPLIAGLQDTLRARVKR